MAFQSTCRRASGLVSLEGATFRTCNRGPGSATCTSTSRHTSLPSPSSSSTSSSRRASHRTKSTLIPRPTLKQQTNPSSVSSTARFSKTAPRRNDGDEQPATIGSPFAPLQTTEQVRAWFKERFPSFQLPDMMLMRTVTHESFDHGKSIVGNNRRLSFLGRRAMHMFLSVFLHSNLMVTDSTATTSAPVPRLSRVISNLLARQEHMDELLLTARLGDGVGRKLGLEQVMRWQPAIADGQRGPKETGLFKIRGVTVEALVGAIYHHYGAAAARAFFHAHVLPHLETLSVEAREELRRPMESAATSGHDFLAGMSSQRGLAAQPSTMADPMVGSAESLAGTATESVERP